MVRRAKRSSRHQAGLGTENPGYRVYRRRFEGLIKAERSQDRGQPFGEHGLARAWRPDHQDVVPAGCSGFERAFHGLLPAQIGEVQRMILNVRLKAVPAPR